MPLFRLRSRDVEAMFFDGSPAGAMEIIEWAHTVAPDITVRERLEYGGWDDTDGHLELEIQHSETQACAGDWIVCTEVSGRRRLDVEADRSFRLRFEARPD